MLEHITTFEIAVTNYCQAKCPSCNRTNEETLELNPWINLTHFDVDMFKKTFSKEYANKHNVVHFKFCGETGDPMMHPRIEEFVHHAFDIGAEVQIATNGGLRQPKWYETMANQYKMKMQIIFGIDGVDHETNNKYRIGVNTERAFENMLTFKKHGGFSKWQFILFDFNYHQIPNVIDKCYEWNIPPMFIWNQGKYGLISPELKAVIEREYTSIMKEVLSNDWR